MKNTGTETPMRKRYTGIALFMLVLLLLQFGGITGGAQQAVFGETRFEHSGESSDGTRWKILQTAAAQTRAGGIRPYALEDRPEIQQIDLAPSAEEYKESQLRRFETIFFISLPASFLLSFLGTLLYRGFGEGSEPFSNQEYGYLALSTIGISLSIAFHDNRTVYQSEVKFSGKAPTPRNFQSHREADSYRAFYNQHGETPLQEEF
jgi:hypothetical protein